MTSKSTLGAFATALLLAALAALMAPGCVRSPLETEEAPSLALPSSTTETLDFEALPPGTIVSTVYGSLGSGPIGVMGTSPIVSGNTAVIFDSANPTGGDTDLGTPNEDCGGPGEGGHVGPGTEFENCTPLEHICIIADRLTDADGDGLVDDPDDIDYPHLDGVYVTMDFAALGSVTAHSITIIDFDGNAPDPRVELYDSGGAMLASVPLPNDMPDNGVATVPLGDVEGVVSMIVHIQGSGGFDTVVFTPEGEEPEEVRVTGGGVDQFDQWDGTLADGKSGDGSVTNRYTFGGQAGAPAGSPPQPYGEWTHHQVRGPAGSFVFHAGTSSAPDGTEIDWIEASDPGWCDPARRAPAKQIDFAGVGTFHNIRNAPPELSGVVPGETFHWFEVHIEDLGEPGRNGRQTNPGPECPPEGSAGLEANCDCPDFYHIKIYAGVVEGEVPNKTDVIYEVYGYVLGGNLQIHPAIR